MPSVGRQLVIGAVRGLGAALGALLLGSLAASAAPPLRLALVIGETTYAAFPALPVCAGSARSVAGALRHDGYDVIQKLDATNGETEAAFSSFVKRLADAPGSTAVVYFCGYAASLDTRSFLLPVSATIARPFDLLTQGVVVRSVFDALLANGTVGGVLALDAFPQPGTSGPPALDRVAQGVPMTGHAYIGVLETNSMDAATPLATALAQGLNSPTVDTGALIGTLQSRLAAAPGIKVAAQAPASTSYLAGGPPQSVAEARQATKEAPAAEEAAKEPAQARAAPGTPPAASAPPPAPAPQAPAASAIPSPAAPALPEEDRMTQEQRRRVQAALAVLGYYSGRIDGEFGQETRAAIRRFQHEIGSEMTGRLTPAQAGRLVAGRS